MEPADSENYDQRRDSYYDKRGDDNYDKGEEYIHDHY